MKRSKIRLSVLLLLAVFGITESVAQPIITDKCTATALNRTVQLNPNGTFVLRNVPAIDGPFRVRIFCEAADGTVSQAQTEFIQGVPDTVIPLGPLTFGTVDPVPVSLTLNGPPALTQKGETTQLTATALLPDTSTKDVTPLSEGTLWSSSNSDIADVGEDGLLTANKRGRVIVTARNEGVASSFEIDILIPNDADGDGLSDEFELAVGLNPNDPNDAFADNDGDGLSNLEESQLGTNINLADSDGDGISDGDEIFTFNTDPLNPDSDGDGLLDGDEVRLGTNLLEADSDGDGLLDGDEVELGLDPFAPNATTTVVGRVVDGTGAAVEGASVSVFSFTETTDATGSFVINNVPVDFGTISAFVRFITAGVVFDGLSDDAAPTPNGITDLGEIRLEAIIGRVTGVISGPFGDPIANARVTVTSGVDERSVNTNALGEYQADDLPPGAIQVTVFDPGTGLRGRALDTLSPDGSVIVDITLAPSGTIQGVVLDRDAATVLGEGIPVDLSGPATRNIETNGFGEYRFDFVPLGVSTMNASDSEGNRGRSNGTLTSTNQVVDRDISFLGRGDVSGFVETATGTRVAGATVSLNSQSIFGGNFTTTTDSNGDYLFEGVFLGNFSLSAQDTTSNLGGNASGVINFDGDTPNISITLQPAGTLAGTIFQADGATPAEGVSVSLNPSGRTVTTDVSGLYQFDNLTLGTYTADVTNPLNGDRARGIAALTVAGDTVPLDITLNGTATVTVRVEDAGGGLVPGAQVIFNSQTIFGGSQNGMTGPGGEVTFDTVLAGNFTVTAMDPLDLLGGSLSSSVLPSESATVTVRLEPSGDILGTVLGPDGVTPQANIRVRLTPGNRQVTTAVDGSFRFDMQPISGSPFSLSAFDSTGALRASSGGIVLANHDDQVIQDLVLSGVGRVVGMVTRPDSSIATGVGVTLSSSVQGSPNRFATTNSLGQYTIETVPEGTFTVNASDPAAFQGGGGSGVITANGEEVTVDIQMEQDVIPPTTGGGTLTTLFDGNNFSFGIQRDGSVRDGTTAVYRGDNGANRGASLLSLGDERFVGAGGGAFEDNGREVVISGESPDPSGLLVTRKIFVPQNGYFARYLEVLSNPTASPIVTDVNVQTHFRFFPVARPGFATVNEPPQIVSTSSGDGLLEDSDNWAVIDGPIDADPFLTSNLPATALVFDGIGVVNTADEVEFTQNFDSQFALANTVWQNVLVPAGETVILMHFEVQETVRLSALAAAQRLEQLPPEALAGLSPDERLQIINFPVAPDGSSSVPAFVLDGAVEGTVFEADASTPVANSRVTLQSTNLIYNRTYSSNANASGAYSFASVLQSSGRSVVIPQEPFDVEARHPASQILSGPVAGSFPSGSPAIQDIVFGNTGIIDGTVRRPDGTVISTGNVKLSGGGLVSAITRNIATDGTFRFSGVPAGTYTLQATLPVPGGSDLSGTTTAAVTAGASTIADITIESVGSVNGRVTTGFGAPAINRPVSLLGTGANAGFSRNVTTDTGGNYLFLDVPPGTYDVRASEPNTGIPTVTSITVVEAAATTQDLVLIALGTLQIEATFPDASPVPDAQVQIRREAFGDFFANVGLTNASGNRILNNTPAGNFTVRVLNPQNSTLIGEVSGTLTTAGETIVVSVEVPVDQPPSVVLTAPVAGDSFLNGTTITATADATDDLLVNRVDFLVDGVIIASDFSAPFAANFPLTLPAVGSQRTLIARATDSGNNVVDSTAVVVDVLEDLEPPEVNMTSPVDGATFIEGTGISLVATATDNVGVTGVEFRANSVVFATDVSSPYTANYLIPASFADSGPTTLALDAAASDAAGNIGTDSIAVNVIPDEPPLINLVTAPAPDSNIFEGTSVFFSADATDDISVTTVELVIDGVVEQVRTKAPFQFNVIMPELNTVTNPIQIELRARDTQNQTTTTAPLPINIVQDTPPAVSIDSPALDQEFVEGSTITVAATATDDIGVTQVEFFVDGLSVGVDTLAPYSVDFMLSGGDDLTSVELLAVATDTADQTGSFNSTIIRRDDLVPPAVSITAPADGSIVSLGASDVVIVIDTSGSTSTICGADVDGDGFDDTILTCEVEAARQLLDFFDAATTRVAIVDFSSSAVLVQSLTDDFSLAEQALDGILARGPSGGTNFNAAMNVATSELIGARSSASATPVQLFLSDGKPNDFPTDELNRAAGGGIIVNTFAVGAGASTDELQQIADGTGGTLTSVVDPVDLVELLPNIILFGINGLGVATDASDETAVKEVEFTFLSEDGTMINATQTDDEAPFNTFFSLPNLTESIDLNVTATARDFGDNTTDSTPILVTLLPSDNEPQVVSANPFFGVPGQSLTIPGRFFDATEPLNNTVTFEGAGARISAVVNSATKISLDVTIPIDAIDGPVTVEVDGVLSNADVLFKIDSDLDGLSDADETTLGTDPENSDTDGDGLSDGNEVNVLGTDPLLADTDEDTLDDGVEVVNDLDPLNPDDAGEDGDSDGLTNAEEITLGTNRLVADTDGDGLVDGDEVNVHGTDPLVTDSDGDNLSDGIEVVNGLDPLDGADASQDFDTDGLDNITEISLGTDLNNPDSDSDGVLDGNEVNVTGTDPLDNDSDNDGLLDGVETNTGLFVDANDTGTNPLDPDTDDGGAGDGPEIATGTDPLDLSDDVVLGEFFLQDTNTDNIYSITVDRSIRVEVARADILALTGLTDVNFFNRGLALDKRGNLYFSDSVSNSVMVRDNTGALSTLVTSEQLLAVTGGTSVSPAGLATGNGFVYVIDTTTDSVIEISTVLGTAQILVTVEELALAAGSSIKLDAGIQVEADGTVLIVSDGSPDAVFAVGTDRTITVRGNDFLGNPDVYTTLDNNGDLIIGDDDSSTVARLTPAGVFSISLSTTQIEEPLPFSADLEGGLAFDSEGNFYIAEENNDAILRFDPSNSFTGEIWLSRTEFSAQAPFPSFNGDMIFSSDTDGDGLDTADEITQGTSLTDPDTDDDGLLDGFEVAHGFDPLTPGEGVLDSDGDGLDNLTEQGLATDPNAQDTDGDGLIDFDEVNTTLTFPNDPDTDNDGLLDSDEINIHATNPLDSDTDGGGAKDGVEINVDGTDPLDPADDIVIILLPENLNDGNGFLWDIQQDGNISDGTSDAYDGGLNLSLNGVGFPEQPTAQLLAPDRREVVIGPVTDEQGLVITRRIFVPDNDAFARFLEIIENPTASNVDVTVRLNSNLGSDSSTQVISTSSGDTFFNVDDDFLITDDSSNGGGDPTLLHVISNPGAMIEPSSASISNDDIAVSYDFTLAPGARAIIMHFAAQNADQATASAAAPGFVGLTGNTLNGLTLDDRLDIVNFISFADNDSDGLADELENLVYGTDTNNPDTDGDGLLDGFEVNNGFDPLVSGEELLDTDVDGLNNLVEQAEGTDPNDADTDDDSLTDGNEVNVVGTHPLEQDTDFDALNDADELFLTTNPLAPDTDEDGFRDGFEVQVGTDPLLSSSIPGFILMGTTAAGVSPSGLYEIDPLTGAGTFVANVQGFDAVSSLDQDMSSAVVYGTGRNLLTFDRSLFMLNITDGSTQPIGFNLAGNTLAGLSIRNADSRIFAFSNESILGILDSFIGNFLPIGLFSDACCGNAIAFDSLDLLYHADDDAITRLNPLNASLVTSVPFTFSAPLDNFPRVAGMDFDPITGILYGTVLDEFGGPPETILVTIDPTTGVVANIGPTVNGLASLAWIAVIIDADADGISDGVEILIGTDPNNPDSDGDGLLDGFEENNGFDPLAGGEEVGDPDGDGLNNLGEQNYGSDPFSSDTDGDNLRDGDEVNTHGTDPINADSDDDGFSDGNEIELGSDPLDSADPGQGS